MLIAIFTAVAPGLAVPSDATLAIAFVALVLYVVEAIGGVYDLVTATVQEVRS